MKTFYVKYDEHASSHVISRLRSAAKARTPQADSCMLWCDSHESMFRILSPARIDLLSTLHEHQPESIDELAMLLARDMESVHRDVRSLAEIGILRLEMTTTGG